MMLRFLLIWFAFVHYVYCDEAAEGEKEKISLNTSILAYKMKGVCLAENLTNVDSCNQSSLSINPNNVTTQFTDFPEKHYIKVKLQNNILLTELVHRSFYDTQPPPHKPEFGFQHLASAFAIYSKACPLISSKFLQKVFHLFSFLHYKTAKDRTEYLSKSHHKWITKLINNCSEKIEPLMFYTDVCKETVLATENCESVICTNPDHEFRLKKSDPLLDAVFKVFELTQSVCFPVFNESYRMFHFFRLAVMDTFTDDIKIRWTTPVENMRFFRKLLGPNFETEVINMERCNEATMAKQKFYYRIKRNSLPARIRLGGLFKRV